MNPLALAMGRSQAKVYPEDVCVEIIKENPEKISMIDTPTERMCIEAVKLDPALITILGPKDLTEKICQEAVSRDGLLLANIPSKYKTIELCMMALEQNPEAIKYFEF